jgi:hypothetical protein
VVGSDGVYVLREFGVRLSVYVAFGGERLQSLWRCFHI